MKFRNVTFEISLKPFKDTSDIGIKAVCEEIFTQWASLTRHADIVSIMFWAADGSEILDYRGNLDDEFEWAYWQGLANCFRKEQIVSGKKPNVHQKPSKYMENPPVFTYGLFKKIIDELRSCGKRMTGKEIKIGATFDPGPEFAVSEFKYKRHREICAAHTMGQNTFVTCNTFLHADDVAYAAFPNGIPEHTHLGTFLGRQFKEYSTDMGFDYIWFSNGFGFGSETWKYNGELFDSKNFFPEKIDEVTPVIMEFWRNFTNECPDIPIETRGSNLTAGIEMCTDGCPVKDIYEQFKPAPPINSPWAALNRDFGVELAGWMSHIAELPEDHFTFRFYTHDPWFLNSPWLDRYGRQPMDIYLPLSVSRLDENGDAQVADSVNLLSIDDSRGNMPEQVPDEVIPHIKQAFRYKPDGPGLLTWVYPFDEYSDFLKTKSARIKEIFAEDFFIKASINHGLPLNTVVSTRILIGLLSRKPSALNGSTLVVPVGGLSETLFELLLIYVDFGGSVFFYGSLENASLGLRELLGVKIGEGITGEMRVESELLNNKNHTSRMFHTEEISAGPLTERTVEGDAEIMAKAVDGDESSVLALRKSFGAGKIAWIRVCSSSEKNWNKIPYPPNPKEYFHIENLMRYMLEWFGTTIDFGNAEIAEKQPMITISRHDNAFMFSGFSPNMNYKQSLGLPFGAPICTGTQAVVENGIARYNLPLWFHLECRTFVKQDGINEISANKYHAAHPYFTDKVMLNGLDDAEVIFFPPKGLEDKVEIYLNSSHPHISGETPKNFEKVESPSGIYFKVPGVTGQICFAW